jgi:hypothetical protein
LSRFFRGPLRFGVACRRSCGSFHRRPFI